MIQSILYRILSLIKLPPWTPYESNDSTKVISLQKFCERLVVVTTSTLVGKYIYSKEHCCAITIARVKYFTLQVSDFRLLQALMLDNFKITKILITNIIFKNSVS